MRLQRPGANHLRQGAQIVRRCRPHTVAPARFFQKAKPGFCRLGHQTGTAGVILDRLNAVLGLV